MEPKGIARTVLQQRLASAGIDPARAADYLCGCLISGGMRYAFKQSSDGKEFPSMTSIINREMRLQKSALPHLQVHETYALLCICLVFHSLLWCCLIALDTTSALQLHSHACPILSHNLPACVGSAT